MANCLNYPAHIPKPYIIVAGVSYVSIRHIKLACRTPPGLLPVRSMREGYAFVSVCVYVCVCGQKNTLVYVSPLENLHENTLCSFFTEFIDL